MTSDRLIIAFNGKKGSGKSESAQYLEDKHGFTRVSFAAKMKQSGAAALHVPVTLLERHKNNPEATVEVRICGDLIRSITVREYYQRYGTEAHRDIFGEDIWVDQVRFDNGSLFVVEDARFDNECQHIQAHGGLIVRIERPGVDDHSDDHSSEILYEANDITLVNDTTLEDLYRGLDEIVASAKG